MYAVNSNASIIQNLADAGCDEAAIAKFMDSLKNGKTAEGLKLLEKHRRSLLNELHKQQQKIDCLDYLMHNLRKGKTNQ